MRLTKLEKKIYDYICDYWSQHGFSPAIADISAGCYVSHSTAYDYILRLFDKGYITYVPRIARSITVKKHNEKECQEPGSAADPA